MPPEGDPGPLHTPPADLPRRSLPLRTRGGPWFRIHAPDRDPVFFGRTGKNRFDAPAAQFGVLYLAADASAAFIETLGRAPARRSFTIRDLSMFRLAEILPSRPLRLVDVTGPGLARLGADARLFTGDHSVARAWSLALHGHPAAPDGILYPSRHDPSRHAAAVFDRVKGRFHARNLGRLSDQRNRKLLAGILDRYGFGLDA